MGLNKISTHFIVLYSTFFLAGCGLTGDLVDWKGDAGLEQYAQERNEMLAQFKGYIGKDSVDIRKNFGNPADRSSPAWYKKIKYDEVWHYKIEKGVPVLFPNQYFVRFYFIKDKVVEIEVS